MQKLQLSFNPLLKRHRQLAPNASVRVSPLCLGTMTCGTSSQARYGEITKDEIYKILDTFYTRGGNFVDTANVYHNEESEQWLGEWMASRGNRDEMVVATKYTSPYRISHKDEIQSNFVGNGTKSMKVAIEASLKNLKTSYIDIFYVHVSASFTSYPLRVINRLTQVFSGRTILLRSLS